MSTTEYVNYIIEPFKDKALVTLAMVTGLLLTFLEEQVGLNVGLVLVYFLFAIGDMAMGIYKNVIVKKNDFKSELFFKKILSVAVMFICVYSMTQLILYVTKMSVPNVVSDHFQGVVVYGITLSRLFVVIAFLAYEITSLRENAVALQWRSLIDMFDIILFPLTLLKNKLQKSIHNDEEKSDSNS